MSKKYRLEINYSEIDKNNIGEANRLVQNNLDGMDCERMQDEKNGDTYFFKNVAYGFTIRIGWLTEIKGPLSFDEWDKSCPSVVPSSLNYQIPQSELDKFVDLHRRLGWNACLENQKLEKEIKPSCPLYADYEKSCSALKERIKELEK